ncbi:MAG: protein kinase [Acidobacteriota bacterium]
MNPTQPASDDPASDDTPADDTPKDDTASDATPADDTTADTRERSATLLVVDDTESSRDMLARRLERKGYRVLEAGDGETALRLAAESTVDLVLLDIMMPGMDGVEVLRHLRAERGPSELPVIMQTARTDSDSMVEALEVGANDYVTKPIDFPVVLARVQKELRTRDDARKQRDDAATTTVRPGAVLAGRYRLERKIGSGNFGSVYRGHHLELDTPVAIKILQTRMAETPDAVERFRAEGRSACMVRHPNAVTVYDFATLPDGIAFLVMELLEGHALSHELRLHGRLTLARVDEVLRPVAAALAEAHSGGIVHRDIKPDNIFVHRGRQGEVIKVLDFGIAKLVGAEVATRSLTTDGFVLGTPAYMAPERLRDEAYDGRSDVYSLGIALFQLLTGRLPFEPDKDDPMALLIKHLKQSPPSLRQIEPSVPAEVDRLVLSCLAKKPGGRPSLQELVRSMAIAAERSTSTAPATPRVTTTRAGVDEYAPTTHLDTRAKPLGRRLAAAFRRLVGGDS